MRKSNPSSGTGSEGLFGTDAHRLVRSIGRIGTSALHSAYRCVVGTDDVIPSVNLIDMVSLTHCVSCRYDDPFALFDEAAEVRFHLYHPHFVVSVDGVYLPVIVEEDGEVVDVATHVDVLPWTGRIFADENLQAVSVDIGEDIELPVVVADAGSPDTLSIRLFSVLQTEFVTHLEAVETIAQETPVYQILGVEHYDAWRAMHGGAGQVEVITHSDEVGVRKLVVEEGVGKGAVAVVSCPGLGVYGLLGR